MVEENEIFRDMIREAKNGAKTKAQLAEEKLQRKKTKLENSNPLSKIQGV